MPSALTPPHAPPGRRECGLAWVVGLLLLPLALGAIAGPMVFARPFWADEVFTWLIARDPSTAHSMAALAGGVDTNAPLLHLILQRVGAIFGNTPCVYRVAMALGMGSAVVGLYLLLRMTRSRLPALIGCLFFCAMPLAIAHATEARFYGLFTAAAIWAAYGVARRREAPGLGSTTWLSLTSVLLCGVHYFGVIALAAIVLMDLLTDGLGFRRPHLRARAARLLPTAAGFAMTACLWPLLRGQRAAVTGVQTWIVDDFAYNLKRAIADLLPVSAILVLTAILCLAVLGGRRTFFARCREACRSPLAAFWLYAIGLILVDRCVQPVLVGRYLILLLPALAAVVAAMVVDFTRPRRIAVAGTLALLVGAQLLSVRSLLATPAPRSTAAILARAQASGRDPIVTDGLFFALPVWAQPAFADRLVYVPPPRFDDAALNQGIAYERQMGKVVHLFYGLPMEPDLTRIRRLDQFTFMTPFPERTADQFPQHTFREVNAGTMSLRRREAEPSAAIAADH